MREALAHVMDSAEYPCEVYCEVADTILYKSTEENQIEYHHIKGAGVTTVVEGVMGFASTHNLDTLEETYNYSKKFAQYGSTPRVLPHPAPPAAVPGADPRIAEAHHEDVADLADRVFAGIPDFCHIVNETIMLKTQEICIINSQGVDVTKKGTFAVLDITLQEKSRKDLTFYSCFYSRTYDIEWLLADEIEKWHTHSYAADDVPPGECDVIFSPLAFSRILDAGFVPTICEGLPGGIRDVPPEVTVYDHGTLEGGMGTAPFDAEGVPQKVTPLITEGECAPLFDTTLGSVHKKKSTGNAYRESFEDPPQVYITNLYIPPVAKTEDLISEVQDGILVQDVFGASITHPPSGEFASTVSKGYRIQKGEITGMIPPKMIEGRISSLFKTLTPGDDVRKVDRYVVPSSKTQVHVY